MLKHLERCFFQKYKTLDKNKNSKKNKNLFLYHLVISLNFSITPVSNKFHQSALQSGYSSKLTPTLLPTSSFMSWFSKSPTNCRRTLPLVQSGSIKFLFHKTSIGCSHIGLVNRKLGYFLLYNTEVRVYSLKIRQRRTITGRHRAKSILNSKLSG